MLYSTDVLGALIQKWNLSDDAQLSQGLEALKKTDMDELKIGKVLFLSYLFILSLSFTIIYAMKAIIHSNNVEYSTPYLIFWSCFAILIVSFYNLFKLWKEECNECQIQGEKLFNDIVAARDKKIIDESAG